MTQMQEPEIRTVEMVRSIRDAHYEQIKDLSSQEKIAFFREKARLLHAEIGRPEALVGDLGKSAGETPAVPG